MEQYIRITCRHRSAGDLVKNRRSENGTQRYHVQRMETRCEKSDRTTDPQQFRGRRYQQESQYLKEYRALRAEKKAPAEVNPYFIPRPDSTPVGIGVEIRTDAEADEFRSNGVMSGTRKIRDGHGARLQEIPVWYPHGTTEDGQIKAVRF